jgi:hypothetical protein
MAKILFRLRNVPDDEADEVRELLTTQGFDIYETGAGSFGISLPAIWLKDESRFEEARRVLEEYQRSRQQRVREEYAQLKREGRQRTLLDVMHEGPLHFVLSLATIALIAYLCIRLVLDLLA